MDEIKEEKKTDEPQQQQDGQQQASNKHNANKLIYKKLREQMEFYFSDSNLSKDRFLKQEILKTPEGYLDLSVFLKFNKIRSLTDDLNALKKAIKKSDILELDENKVNIRRKTPFVELEQNDIDKRTVYVENLPSHVDHELLKRIFSRCGNVAYISLPKFKSTKQIKGFAFVEFDSKESAKKAIEMLNDPIVEQNVEVGKFPKYNKQLISLEEKVSKVSQLLPIEEMEVVSSANEDNNSQQEVTTVDVVETTEAKKEKKAKNKKRKLAKINDSLEASKEPNEKERKVDENDEKKVNFIETSNEQNKEEKTENDNEEAPKKKKKNRRRKHSVMNAKKMKKEMEVESTLLHLRVISKKEWLKLKKEYLNKQKENLSELKSKLKEISEKVGDGQKKHSYQRKNDESVEKMSTDMETAAAPESSNEFSGCILKLTPKTIDDKVHSLFKLTRQQFKNEKLKEYEKDVAYVDLEKHTNKVFIRCKNRDIAKDLLNKSEFLNEFNRALISGKEENEYFEKIDKNKTKGQLKKEKKLRGKSEIVQKTYDIIDKSGLRGSNDQQEKYNKYKNRPPSSNISNNNNNNNKPVETKGGHLKFDD